jgi:hypothetical protein
MMDKVLVSNITAGSRATVEELRVQHLGSTGFGNYECVVNNSVGIQSAAAEFSGKCQVFLEVCNFLSSSLELHKSIHCLLQMLKISEPYSLFSLNT